MADDDLKASLPDPPPPAPARRDAAIREAMRRFDGEGPAPAPQVEKPAKGIWRPQLGAAVTVGLMALIGVPAAWMTAVRHNDAASPRAAPAAYDAAPPASASANETAPAPPSAALPAAPKPSREEVAAAAPAVPPPPAEAAPLQSDRMERAKASPNEDRPEPPHPSAFASQPMAAPPPPPIVAAPMAPAPPPAAWSGDMVVTGLRVTAGRPARGDWNACTIDDPSRNLALCGDMIDAAAPGSDGAAAAHVADGLSRAWAGDADGAIQSFDAAIAIAPGLSQAYLNRSLAYARQGDMERALADANKAVRTAPDTAKVYYNRATILRRQGRTAKARADEARALQIDPGYQSVLPR